MLRTSTDQGKKQVWLVTLICLAVGQSILAGIGMSDEPSKPKSDDSQISPAQERRLRMLELAKSYSFVVPNAPEPLKLVEKPLFSWSTPERRAIGGEMYLWTMLGRPFASIGIWTFDDVLDHHELQSLAEVAFEASTTASTPNVAPQARLAPWRPRTAGIEYKLLPGANPPEASAVRRLAQIKSILRDRFGANVTHDNGNTEELRMLAQPLYRYQTMPPGVIDGYMFAFAMGTDPEVLVIAEARSMGDSTAWYYAVAPATSVLARCTIDLAQVWTSEKQRDNMTFIMYSNRQSP